MKKIVFLAVQLVVMNDHSKFYYILQIRYQVKSYLAQIL